MSDNRIAGREYERSELDRIERIESNIRALQDYVVEDKVEKAISAERYREIRDWMKAHAAAAETTRRAILGSAIAIIVNVIYQIISSGVLDAS